MTYLLKIVNGDDSDKWTANELYVDFTNGLNPSFTFNFSNPIITIPTPMSEDDVISKTAKWNVVTMNLNMNTQTINIEAKESLTGLTLSSGAINFDTAATMTVFEKLLALSMDSAKKKLYINDSSEPFALVEIEGYRASVGAGAKDLIEHSLTLVVSSDY
jgi:hypothetical protein